MLNRIAFLSVAAAALGAVALPHAAVAADYYDEGRGPVVFHSRDDIEIDGGRARVEHRQDLQPFGGDHRFPGPVAFDERDPDHGYGHPVYGYGHPVYGDGHPVYGDGRPVYGEGHPVYGYGRPEGVYRRPVAVERPAYGYGGPVFDGGYGPPYRPAPAYRPVSAPVYGEGLDERAGLPDVGCTVQEAQSTTPAGWRKIVTHRTCYRR